MAYALDSDLLCPEIGSCWAAADSNTLKKYFNSTIPIGKDKIQMIAKEWNRLCVENTEYRELDSNTGLLKSSYPGEIDGLTSYERTALLCCHKQIHQELLGRYFPIKGLM